MTKRKPSDAPRPLIPPDPPRNPAMPGSSLSWAVSSARYSQVGGQHYVGRTVQPWDVWASDPEMDPFTGAVIKYVMRWRHKNGVEDLRKARHTLDRLIEIEEAKTDRPV